MSNRTEERTSSMAGMVLGVTYLGLMLFCLWSAVGERSNYANECQRYSNNCTTTVSRT
jgi:hypothetical protein